MKIKTILTNVAPFIASLFGSPLMGVAVQTLGELLLDNKNANQQEIEQELSQVSPEILMKLKKLDAELKAKFLTAGLSQANIDALDRKSARDREILTKDWVPALLAFTLTIGFFSILFLLIFVSVPSPTSNILNVMIGAIGTAWMSCITYYFGSSHGSKLKSEIFRENYAQKI